MQSNRREFLKWSAAGMAVSLFTPATLAQTLGQNRIKAIAFDAFPIFDPRPVFRLVVQLFPERGADLVNAWRTRQFEYTWLHSLMGKYVDFWQVTEAALVFSAKMLKLDLDDQKRAHLMQAYLNLSSWPEAPVALNGLKQMGFRLAFLSNFTPRMLSSAIKNASLDGLFEHVISTDAAKIFKPAPRAYQLVMDAFKLRPEEVLFVAYAGWDAAGAKSFGFPTYWVNRLNLPREELGSVPDASGADLTDLVDYLKTMH